MTLDESLSQLFQRAKDKDEFNFVCTLINYKGMGSRDSTANFPEWINAINFYESLYTNEEDVHKKLRIGLLIYSTFFESSDLYNVLGNLARNILGFRGSSYLYWRHEKSDRWLGTSEKVSLVTEILLDVELDKIVEFFNENHYKQLRNSFFHSSYSLEQDNYYLLDSEPIYINELGSTVVSIKDFILPKVNSVLSFFHSFKEHYQIHFSSYKVNKQIKGHFPDQIEITILGSNDGLSGFVAGGSYIKLENNFWTAMNIVFEQSSEVRRFIIDELKRFISKERIRTDDGSLQHLNDVITERDIKSEKQDLATVYQRFGDMKYAEVYQETNSFKQMDLAKRALSFYQKMLNLDETRVVTNDIAVLKYSIASNSGNQDLKKESLNDFINL